MRRRRSTLWLSLALLLLGGTLIVPGAMPERATASASWEPVRVPAVPPIPSSSASLIDSGSPPAPDGSLVIDDAPQRLDLRGNEISRPIARYRVDDSGIVYEEHSPQTEVPRLKQPVM